MTTEEAVIETPFPPELYSLAWDWLHEFPSANFDDSGPTTFENFKWHIAMREQRGDTIWLCRWGGAPVGIVGYQRLASHLGVLAGICFMKSAHGTRATHECFRKVLGSIFESGVTKLSASYFSDNVRVREFLRKYGAVTEGHLREHAMRGGIATGMDLVAIFK